MGGNNQTANQKMMAGLQAEIDKQKKEDEAKVAGAGKLADSLIKNTVNALGALGKNGNGAKNGGSSTIVSQPSNKPGVNDYRQGSGSGGQNWGVLGRGKG